VVGLPLFLFSYYLPPWLCLIVPVAGGGQRLRAGGSFPQDKKMSSCVFQSLLEGAWHALRVVPALRPTCQRAREKPTMGLSFSPSTVALVGALAVRTPRAHRAPAKGPPRHPTRVSTFPYSAGDQSNRDRVQNHHLLHCSRMRDSVSAILYCSAPWLGWAMAGRVWVTAHEVVLVDVQPRAQAHRAPRRPTVALARGAPRRLPRRRRSYCTVHGPRRWRP